LLEAYCVKCKTKRELKEAVPGFNSAGAPITRGVCPVCGTKMVRIGKTPEHEGLIPPPKVKRQPKRNGNLVIVESPAKAKTVGRFLGKGYTVKASIGHVRDLLRSSLSVDIDNGFEPKYRVPNEKRPVVKDLKQVAKTAEHVYLATDPDREGEAIAWHLMEAADIDPETVERVVFHEITEKAINEAFNHSRHIDMNLVDAQQARRVLDRLVGYSISPLLWEKVRSRLSAGRVQSVALRLVVEREKEIENFVPVEYWTIQAELLPEGGKDSFFARLVKVDQSDPALTDEASVNEIVKDMEQAAYRISKIKRGVRKRKPSAPFTTSTLQQEASRKLGFTTKRTMTIAQQLYEGLDVGNGGSTGLITYMRTDSTNVAGEAQQEARQYIIKKYGKAYVPTEVPQYKTKAKGAQEAHEAVRPTSTLRVPEAIKSRLSSAQYKLYQLIWKRFVASQMEAAEYDTLSVDIDGVSDQHNYQLRTTGSTLRFEGFLAVYEEAKDEDQSSENGDDMKVPANLEEGQKQKLLHVLPEQHFTQPPPRFTDASLVKTLEEYGIGRPSTYAAILSTIQDRGYVYRETKRLYPTETGSLVNDLLVNYFSDIVNVNFSAQMEDDLDLIAEGKAQWREIVGEFYNTFEPQLKHAQDEMPEQKAGLEKVGRSCPKCGHDLVIRWGRYGKFISCSNFPECRYTEPWLEKIGVPCPECGGDIVRRRTRKGRVFFGCSNYPECQFTSWKEPISTHCPNCNGTLVIANKTEVKCLSCEESFLRDHIEQIASEKA